MTVTNDNTFEWIKHIALNTLGHRDFLFRNLSSQVFFFLTGCVCMNKVIFLGVGLGWDGEGEGKGTDVLY